MDYEQLLQIVPVVLSVAAVLGQAVSWLRDSRRVKVDIEKIKADTGQILTGSALKILNECQEDREALRQERLHLTVRIRELEQELQQYRSKEQEI